MFGTQISMLKLDRVVLEPITLLLLLVDQYKLSFLHKIQLQFHPSLISCSKKSLWRYCGIFSGTGLTQLNLLEPCNGRLEASVVVSRHLVHDVVCPVILVVVFLIWTSNKCAFQDMRVGSGIPKIIPVAYCRGWRTRAWSVMWPLRWIVAKSHDKTAPAVPKHVANLLLSKSAVDTGL